MFSDGFADQFGGGHGQKYSPKQLRGVLLENADAPMSKQKKILEKEFITWKGHERQVDDVLVMGIRI
jgi:hypothetical protein